MLPSISNHDLWKATVSNFFDRPCVNLICADAGYVGAGTGLCGGVDVLSISTVVRILVNLAIVACYSGINMNFVRNLLAESPPTFGQWTGK
jgi:hypothetical protein